MKKLIKFILTTIAVVLTLSSFMGCLCFRPVQVSQDGKLVIVQQPISQLAKKNSKVSFLVVAMHVGHPTTNLLEYQWSFNGVPIPGATSQIYTISDVQFHHVGEYRVIITGSSITSAPAFLSVYSSSAALSGSSGTLATPIGQFSSGSWTVDGATFEKSYSPTYVNSNGATVPALFYGPNASPQAGPFQNSGTSAGLTLVVDTFSSSNGSADTGLMVQNNFIPINPPICANNNATGGTSAGQSKCGPLTLSQNSGNIKNSYRLTVLYKDPPGAPNGSITINWKYQ